MTTQTEALDMITKLRLAHQAMEAACERIDQLKAENKELKEALANHIEDNLAMVAQLEHSAPHGEPVAMRHSFDGYGYKYTDMGFGGDWIGWTRRQYKDAERLYTHPPQRTWVGLTDERKKELWISTRAAVPRYEVYAHLVEKELKELNI